MTIRILLCGLVAGLMSAMSVSAHHSFAGTYDFKKQVKVEGTLIRVQWRNPHSFVHVKGADETGAMQEWAVEWSGVPALAGAGITSTTLSVGDAVVITGNPTRTAGEHRLRMLTLLRKSDGFSWGTRPSEVVD